MATAMEKDSAVFSMENIRSARVKFFEDLFRHVLQVTEGIESTSSYDFSNLTRRYERFLVEEGIVLPSESEIQFEHAPRYASGSSSAATAGCDSASGYESTSRCEAAAGHGIDISEMFNFYDKNMGLAIARVLTEVSGKEIDEFYQDIKEKILNRENLKRFIKKLAKNFLGGSPDLELYFLAVVSRIFTLLYKSDGLNPKIFIDEVADYMLSAEVDLQLVTMETPKFISDILNGPHSWEWKHVFSEFSVGHATCYFPN